MAGERDTPRADKYPVSRLPPGGNNLFQEVKRVSAEAAARGVDLIKLSIGQPSGPALESARIAAAVAVASSQESMHEYQDNGSPGVPDFAPKFVQAHVDRNLQDQRVDYLPIPGIKPMLGLIPLATGAAPGRRITIATMTKPGYPTPRDWSSYLNQSVQQVPLNSSNEFRLSTQDLRDDISLIMINYPHNPTGQVATREYYEKLCDYCSRHNIRIFNDGAYIALRHTDEAVSLADVAVDFPKLSWAEAYSASKLIGNGTGWRVGAIVGSPDFVGDIKTIKGNTDSGFAAPLAAGVLAAIEHDQEGIQRNREMYGRRINLLTEILQSHGMRLAVEPKAGFFTLWEAPRFAFGKETKSAEEFNFEMINKTGVVGVHFDPYIRYAVCGDVEAMAEKIDAAFKEANVSY